MLKAPKFHGNGAWRLSFAVGSEASRTERHRLTAFEARWRDFVAAFSVQ